ncbi:hypothetical protein CVS40_10316 [Lucilia cuprina]|nr:hypothetical protein CVS40_10316 [Lucilia cuprina]
MFCELIADIGDSVFSLLIDESTDVSVKKQLGIVVRYYSLGTDNANAMVGANEGVIAQLKKKNSNIILVPCVCHSVQLASPSRQNSYQSLYLSLNNGQESLKIVRACDTRWLSIEVAVKRIVDQWFELKAHLSELYTDYNLAYLLFLKPVLAEVQKVNKSFESNSVDPTKLFSDLKCLLQSLCSQIVITDENFDSLSPLSNF